MPVVARKPLTWQGTALRPGEALYPEPTGRRRNVLVANGFAYESESGSATMTPAGFVCDRCDFAANTPHEMARHNRRFHLRPEVPQVTVPDEEANA